MSLTSFVQLPAVRAKMQSLRPKTPRRIYASLKVRARSNRHMLVGTAFDYLLRFELQRQAAHTVSERWVAEYAPDLLSSRTDILLAGEANQPTSLTELAVRADHLVTDAKVAVAGFVLNRAPDHAVLADMAAHAIRLAKLDSIYRALCVEPHFEEAAPEDVQDLIEMLAIVPFGELRHPDLLFLNPNFNETSHLVGGADCDLIAGNMLVDFKTTEKSEMDGGDLDQLLGYLLLARKQRAVDASFPAIRRLGLYFCRHGHLWSMEAWNWTSHLEFTGLEKWFFQRALEESGRSCLYSHRNAPNLQEPSPAEL